VGLNNNFKKYLLITFCVLAIGIIAYVLFQYPQPGVADQGDFDRVMSASGLELTDKDKNDPNFDRFLKYIVTDYKISDLSIQNLFVRIISTSMAYLITLITLICKIFGQNIFKTGYLSIVYSLIYIFSMSMIINYINININNKIKLIVFCLIILFVFLDGNYLVWFNSLYGEAMMITTFTLLIASYIYYIYDQYSLKSQEKIVRRTVFLFIAAFLFLGSKMQVLTSLPIVVFIIGKSLWENKNLIKKSTFKILCIILCIIIIYPININMINRAISKDTQYNSVFYGILNGSENPRQDLIDMGLNPEMALEAGKHAYLNKEEYVKYVPHTEITEREFYSKMSNGKLVKFYITHPVRFIQGMEYTADHAFFTGTLLGKYNRGYSEEPISDFNRFTKWSSIRSELLHKTISFIVLVYLMMMGVSLFNYIKNKDSKEIKAKIQLLWGVMLIGVFQFPMPFVGNGQADTSKQLYLFNFVFDIMLVVSVFWCFNKIIDLINFKRNN
jgi:hypothetical protein